MRLSFALQFKAGFAAAFVLVAAILGGMWWAVFKYERELIAEEDRAHEATVQLATAESALWQLRYGFPHFMIGDAQERRGIVEEEPKWYAVIRGALDAYEKTVADERERVGLAELRAEYARYVEARPRFFQLYAAGRTEEAIAWRALTTTPYGAATLRAFDRQIVLRRQANEEMHAQKEREIARIHAVVVAASALLVVLLGAGYWMFHRLLAPVAALHAEAARVVRERLGRTLEQDGAANEIVALESSFREMTDGLGSHARRLELARAQLEGQARDLELRVAERTAQLQERQRASEELGELTQLLQAAESLDDVPQILTRLLGRLLAGHSGAVYLAKSSLNYLDRISIFGADGECAQTVAPVECWALKRGHAYGAADAVHDVFCAHVAPASAPAGYVCVPMHARGAPVGMLHVRFAPGPQPAAGAVASSRRHLQHIAELVAVGLANLKLRETLREQSIRDALTGLFNRRYLQEALERDLARAGREAQPLAVFMLDVDHFKRFNDVHGHEAGDAVLRTLGKTLQQACRTGDLACRFGGEEFTVLLSGADSDGAALWAERLMQRVRGLDLKHNGHALGSITISLGLAVFPDHGNDVETLLQTADVALYEAKRAGRDRLMVFRPSPGANDEIAARDRATS